MNQTNRIIVNTLAQYTKIICVIIITLYSTRIVLHELGSSDFGLYSLIGSVLAFLSFLNTTMIKSTQRFLSYYMGKGDRDYQRIVLSNSVLLNAILSLITCAVIIAIEPLVFNYFLNIDSDKIETAKSLYVLMCVSVFFTINASPFSAVFVAHENIVFSSIVYIIVAILRLFSALILCYISTDKLLWYGIFMCLISIFEFLLYYIVSVLKYVECRGILRIKSLEVTLIKSMLTFSFWNLYGTICVVGRNQGYAVIVNRFMGIIANAAYGIANQVSGQITNFVYSLSNAISPIITRSEGASDSRKMVSYSLASSKFSVLMFSVIAIPVLSEIEYILKIWLGRIPEYTVQFVVSIIIACMCDCYSVGLRTGIQAIGKIRNYSVCIYSIKIISIPMSIILLMIGIPNMFVFVPYIITELVASLMTILFFCKYSDISSKYVIKEANKSLTIPIIVSCFISYIIHGWMLEGWWRFMLTFFASTFATIILAYKFSLTVKERQTIKSIISLYVKI